MLFCVANVLHANTSIDKVNFQKISGELSESSISKIIEDTYGFMWIGTTNGIVKYDGTTFKRFDNHFDDYFEKGFVTEIHEGQSGVIYIGTHRGINYYDRALDELKRFRFNEDSSVLNTSEITSILEDNNFLWVGTAKRGLFRYNLKTGETKRIRLAKESKLFNDVLAISKLNADNYVIISRYDALIINENMSIIDEIGLGEIKSIKKIAPKKILLGSFTGYLSSLIVNDNKLSIIDSKKITDFRISAIEVDVNKNIWIAPENDGLFILDSRLKTITRLKNSAKNPDLLPNNSIWSLYNSKNGVMWLGSFKRGLSYNNLKNLKFRHEKSNTSSKNTLSNNIVTSFSEDDKNNIWIGTDGGGLNYWDRKTGDYLELSLSNAKLNSNVILSVAKRNEKLWLATWANGIIVYDLNTGKQKEFNTSNSKLTSNFIQQVYLDSIGRLWVGTFKGGFYVYDETQNDFIKIEIIVNDKIINPMQIMTILEDKNHNIWIGTHGYGLLLVQIKTNGEYNFKQYLEENNKDDNIFFDFINVVFQDHRGKIWVGSDYGLGYYDTSNNQLKKILDYEQLVNLSIESIEQDQNSNLWIGTNKGLFQLDPVLKKVSTYSLEDGVQGNNFNSSATYKTSKGELVFGGSNGFNIFYPFKIKKRQNVPRLYISKLKIQNKQVLPNDEFNILERDISQIDTLTLDYTHNVINFEFATITYSNIKGVNYAYYLEGFDNQWNFVGNKNDVTYTNLDPGKYKFHVKSTNSDGIWVDNQKKIVIKIVPPFWKTWWFKLLIVCIAIGIIYLIFYTRNKRVKATQNMLKKQIADRTYELEQQTNKFINIADELSLKNEEIQRFAFSVSHDLKSPLGNIKTIAQLIQIEFSEKELPSIESYLEMIETSCETMNVLIEDITRVARLGKIENKKEVLDTNKIVKLSKKIINAKFKEHNVQLVIKNDLPFIFADRNRFIQVFSNLLDNSIKYRGDQKTPVIEIKSIETEVTTIITISDNGSGIDAKYLPKLFTPFERFHSGTKGTGLGLYMIKQIILSHDGTITAYSHGKNKGTQFKIILPKYQSQP